MRTEWHSIPAGRVMWELGLEVGTRAVFVDETGCRKWHVAVATERSNPQACQLQVRVNDSIQSDTTLRLHAPLQKRSRGFICMQTTLLFRLPGMHGPGWTILSRQGHDKLHVLLKQLACAYLGCTSM